MALNKDMIGIDEEDDNELCRYLLDAWSRQGHRLLKKLNKMRTGRSNEWFRVKEKKIKRIAGRFIMNCINNTTDSWWDKRNG